MKRGGGEERGGEREGREEGEETRGVGGGGLTSAALRASVHWVKARKRR